MSSAETLGALLEMVPAEGNSRCLEVACGPGLIARGLAERVDSVHGVDLTPAMIELAREEAIEAGLKNVSFSLGDATALQFEPGSFDGALTRFSLHHIPAPKRVLVELVRVLRPGGWLIVGDHISDEDLEAAAWHEEIERLRDPSHWACLTAERLRRFGAELGLRLESERLIALDLDFQEWLGRGSGGPAADTLIEELIADPPPHTEKFRIIGERGQRRLRLSYWLGRWRLPGQS